MASKRSCGGAGRTCGHLRYITLLAVLAGCGAPPVRTVSQSLSEPTPGSTVDRLLDHSGLASIIPARAGTFTRRVALLAEDLTDPELERLVPAVQGAFAPERLRDDVASFVESEDPNDGTLSEVLDWTTGGANAEVRRIGDAYEPALTIEEYTRSLMSSPPDEGRIRLMAEWAESQGAGNLFVLLDEALTEAAYAVWAKFRPNAPIFTPTRGTVLQARLADSFNASIVSFLHRYETVPDTVLLTATAEYATDAGQWYVHTYSLALAEAVRAAGKRVVSQLRTP